jgi:hypothetical protein
MKIRRTNLQSDFDGPERRTRSRFPIELSARYTVDGRNNLNGTVQTVNISSNGVLIRCPHELSLETAIRVVIELPVLIGDACPLALHIHGRVVRTDHGLVAVQYSRHELRTQPKPPGQVQDIPGRQIKKC